MPKDVTKLTLTYSFKGNDGHLGPRWVTLIPQILLAAYRCHRIFRCCCERYTLPACSALSGGPSCDDTKISTDRRYEVPEE
jgi:hypothetical protein